MLRLYVKSAGAISAMKIAGKEMDGVYHLEQTIGNKRWLIVMRDDGKGVMVPSHLRNLIPFMREHLLYSEVWGV